MSPIAALTAAMVLVGTGAGLLLATLSPTEGQHRGLVVWASLAIGFAISEVFVVHVHLRRNSHSFSLSEVPLVIGLFLVTPTVFLASAVVGAGVALVVHRRQEPIKVVFNVAKAALEIAVAVAVFRLVAPTSGIPANHDVVAALGAALAYSIVGAVLVSLAIAASERSWKSVGFMATLPMSALGTMMAASLGLVAVIMIRTNPSTVWLLLVPLAGCYALYAAWTKQSQRIESLQFLYRTAQLLQEHSSIDDAITALLGETREILRAKSVEILYQPQGGGTALHAKFADGGENHVETCNGAEVHDLLAILDGGQGARLVPIERGDPLSRYIGVHDGGIAIIAPLVVGDESVGAFVISPPLNKVSHFAEDERRLVETTARALSVSLEKGVLESSLQKLQTLEQELVHQAYHDPLTQLPNRTRFIERVTEVTKESAADEHFAVLFIDLDDFKTVNDSLGHDAGDALLIEVGKRIGKSLRPGDLAARLGGDEFAVLIRRVESQANAEAAADRFLEALSRPLTIVGQSTRVSASIGVALGATGVDVAGLIKGADVAMYNAKAAGKGRVASFHPAMHEDMMSRYQLLQDVQVALERGELSVEYQPVVNLTSGAVDSVEALIRWDHPELGRIAPDVFVRLAEENRAISDITRLVLHDACAQLTRYAREDLPCASVNVSARDLSAPDFVNTLAQILADNDTEPDRLMCEVTESLLLEESATVTLHALRALGVRVALDDFGTGYSSLQVLRRLPLDQIKIAKPFIDDVELDPSASAFVRAIATLGKTVGLEVVAEGVERPAQIAELRAAGCDAAQGFLFARPMRAVELRTYLERPQVGTKGLVSGLVALENHGERSGFPLKVATVGADT